MAASTFAQAADRNLLFGLLALQMDFIGRDALIRAMHAWVRDKTKPLGQILKEQKALGAECRPLLEALVEEHLKQHDNDAAKCLAAVSPAGSVREELKQIADAELDTSLASMSTARPEEAGREAPHGSSVGTPTSTGLRFRILRPHARGGLGQVSVAQDEELHREVALKEIQKQHADDRENRSRFLLEAEITGGLEHPGIVPVYGLGQYADGRPFYAMRFIKGSSLRHAIAQFHEADVAGRDPGERTLALRQLLRRFQDVCNAIGYAHSRGVLHRDLKPDNIMLGQYGETLVVDWGLAKPIGRREANQATAETTLRPSAASGNAETLPGSVQGTPAYMSPEQAAGALDQLGTASDVYSLGATLYSLLTGKIPFEGPVLSVILQQVQCGQFPAPRKVKPDVPPALEAICLKAMALRSNDRYDSARALADDVEHWLADEPVSAWPEPWTVKARRWAGKHRTLVTGAATAAVVAAACLLVATVLLTEAKDRVENALAAEKKAKDQVENALAAEKKAKDQVENALAAEKKAKDRVEIALAAEKKAKATAEEKEAEARAVLDFVENKVFAAARPEGQDGGLGSKVTVRQAIEAALPFVAASFTKQPLIEARLRRTLGASFWYLGEYRLAAVEYQRARTLYTKYLGPDEPDMLASTYSLALSYGALGRYAEALKLHEETLALRKAKLGPDDPDTLRSMNYLAQSYAHLGRNAEALKLHEETLALRKARLGPDHPSTLLSMNDLALSYAALGRHAEALKLREETLALQKARLGPDHPDTLVSMNNLADSYAALGRYAEALQLHEETLALRKAKLGPDHPSTLLSMNSLALSYAYLGRYTEALKLHKETLALQKAKLGPDHPDTLVSMYNLAVSYADLGNYAEALKLHEETLALRKAKLGPDHRETLRSMNSIALCYAILGRHAESLKLHEETLALRKAILGPDHSDTLVSMNTLALGYATLGRHAEALKLCEETLALLKAKLGPDHPSTLRSMHNVALSYEALRRHADALKLNEETLALRKARLGPDHPDTLSSMNSVATNYYALGRQADALKLHEETLALRKTKLGPDHHDTLWSMWHVAQSLVKLDRGAEALPIIDECLQRAAGKTVDPGLIPGVLFVRLRHFEKKKDAAGCRATAQKFEEFDWRDSGSLYDAACMRAVTAKSVAPAKEAKAEADRAMAWLTQAVASGYNKAAHMRQNPDLDALRQRPDFQKLLAELEANETKK